MYLGLDLGMLYPDLQPWKTYTKIRNNRVILNVTIRQRPSSRG